MKVGHDDPTLHPLRHHDVLLLRRKAGHLKTKLVYPRVELRGFAIEVVDEQRAIDVHASRGCLLAVDVGVNDDRGRYLRELAEPIYAIGSDQARALFSRARSELGAGFAEVARDPRGLRLLVRAEALRLLLGFYGLRRGRRLLGVGSVRAKGDEQCRREDESRESASACAKPST